jgi:PKD-like domain/Secretion system C-terminal sorting domain/Beta-propeller repeat
MIMKKIIPLLCCLISLSLFGQVPAFEWATQIGGNSLDEGRSIATDRWGNVFVTGEFRGTADFDPGPSEHILTTVVGMADFYSDVFVAKYDSDGQLKWAYSFGDTLNDWGATIITDSIGDVYILGHFFGMVDFDPGPNTFYLPYLGSSFVLKLSGNGSFVWVKRLAGSLSSGGESSLIADESGNVYVTGEFINTDDFDPGSAVYNLTTFGGHDIFILKLNSDGDFVWAKSIGGEEWDSGLSIALDSAENVYVTGIFRADADFDPGSGIFILSACGGQYDRDAFILKLNSDGDFVWAKSIGDCFDNITSTGIAVSAAGEVYTTGWFGGSFEGTLDFDPGSEVFNLSAVWESDIFILKLNTEGDFVWAKSIGSWYYESGTAIALDENNNIYTTGYFNGTVDFDPGLDVFNLTSEETDIFILKLDTDGNFVWAGGLIGDGGGAPPNSVFASGHAITIDSWNNIYTTGHFTEITDFDPDASNYELTANGEWDIFIHKLSQQPCMSSPFSISEDLIICAEEEFVLEVDGGIAYQWSTGDSTNIVEITTSESQIYSVTVTDSNGCTEMDSVSVFVHTLSDTTYLELTNCDSSLVGLITYTYFDQNGCDSVVVENTALIPIPEMPTAPADLIIQENAPPFSLVISEVLNATEYLWTVPAGVQIISGQGTNSIIVDWSGTTTGGSVCVSAINDCGNSEIDCMEVTVEIIEGINNTITEIEFSIFPNPASEVINIVFEEAGNYEMELFDALGRKIIFKKEFMNQTTIDLNNIPAGIYWLKLAAIDMNPVSTFVKLEVIK